VDAAAEPASPGDPAAATAAVFGHVLVGIDETPESLVAVAQAGVLRAPQGTLRLLAVSERHLATHAGLAAARAEDDLYLGTAVELSYAKALVDASDERLTSGNLVELLCEECARRDVTLIAVGARWHRRLSALTFGGHDIDTLHDAHCSVLIARPGWGPHRPDRIVFGVDGSPESRTAEAVARSLGARLGCDVVPVVGLGAGVAPEVLREEREDALLDPRPTIEAVAGTASRASLVVVGRGQDRTRRRSNRFVERLVYATRCSVLVVQTGTAAPP
jgi:nucleotide-binding universal stress UspA family protein